MEEAEMSSNVRPESMERITTPALANAFIARQIEEIRAQVGSRKVLLALSGGVDSSVVAALLIKAIGKQLVCVHVNHGLLRKGEPEQVVKVFRDEMDANLIYVDAVDRFLDKLAGEQRIMKYVADKGEKAVFQYVDEGRHCREHLHLKCVQCGRIYHLDCHFMDEVRAHLMAEHGFTLQCEGSVLYGLCRRCAQQNEQAEQTAENSNVDTDKKP
jgi:Fur family ferric uptake transcriptional regulator